MTLKIFKYFTELENQTILKTAYSADMRVLIIRTPTGVLILRLGSKENFFVSSIDEISDSEIKILQALDLEFGIIAKTIPDTKR